ncbi:MAG TPA: phosphatidylglycerophosphatase A, partial [Myxococcota bacterium]|nr:phosphatidylglycerophosphatase A [Myxococcota bacterium]
PARAAERLPGGLGVMADDLVAGLYANLGGQVLWRLWVTGA